MFKVILKAIFNIAIIVAGVALTFRGLSHNDYTQSAVGFILMYLPTIDRIDKKLDDTN